jgi:hypothetical protein
MAAPLLVTFAGGDTGLWRVERISAAAGNSLPLAERLEVLEGWSPRPAHQASWTLRGVTSNIRYTHRLEANVLAAKQQGLARPRATRAALIPIRKSAQWWDLTQDERRAVFEEQSRHIGIGLDYLPEIARRLHHCRELAEPFDFLTWFEYAPEDADRFEELVARLRATPEWRYVEREVDIRLSR